MTDQSKDRELLEAWFEREGRCMTNNDFPLCIAVWQAARAIDKAEIERLKYERDDAIIQKHRWENLLTESQEQLAAALSVIEQLREAFKDIEETRPIGYIDRVSEIAHYAQALALTTDLSALRLHDAKRLEGMIVDLKENRIAINAAYLEFLITELRAKGGE